VEKQNEFFRILDFLVSLGKYMFSKGIFSFHILWKSLFIDAGVKQEKSFPQDRIFVFQRNTPFDKKAFLSLFRTFSKGFSTAFLPLEKSLD